MATPPRGRLQLPVVLLLSLGAALALPTRTPSVSSRLAARCLVTLRFKARRRRLTPTLSGVLFLPSVPVACNRRAGANPPRPRAHPPAPGVGQRSIRLSLESGQQHDLRYDFPWHPRVVQSQRRAVLCG